MISAIIAYYRDSNISWRKYHVVLTDSNKNIVLRWVVYIVRVLLQLQYIDTGWDHVIIKGQHITVNDMLFSKGRK